MRILVLALVFGFLGASELSAAVRSESLWWMPPSVTTVGHQIDFLFKVIFWLTTVVFVATQVVMVIFLVKYRARRGVKATYHHGNNTLEIIWTSIPAAIFILLVIYSNHLWNEIHDPKNIPADALVIEIVGEQYAWNIRYAGADGVLGAVDPKFVTDVNKLGLDMSDPAQADDFVTSNDLKIPVGRAVRLRLWSRDVIHAFYVPEFRLYQDIVPGRTIDWVWFQTDKTGHFAIACSQLCGEGHYNMQASLDVVSPEDFQKWFDEKVKKKLAQNAAAATPVKLGAVVAKPSTTP